MDMTKLDDIKQRIEELIVSNDNCITSFINEKEREYYTEYDKNVKKLKENFLKLFIREDQYEKTLSEFFINNDSLKKKLIERKKLAINDSLNSATVRAELNSSIDFYLIIENVLVNTLDNNGA